MATLTVAFSACTSSSGTTTIAVPPSTSARPTTTQPVVTRTATIVLVVPTTGPLEGLGTEAREGLELAIRHAVEDGDLPSDLSVRVRVLDETARGVARSVDRAARNDDVIAIVGGVLETTEAALAPVARRRKVTLFAFSWGPAGEPPAAVRVGPSRRSMAKQAAQFIRSARPDAPSLAVVATPGSPGSVTMRDEIIALLAPTDPTGPGVPTILTSAPNDPSELAQLPVVVTGAGDPAFENYARLRPVPQTEPPSAVVPSDALGCRTKPTEMAPGTRCVSRGTWHGTQQSARTFREDAAAAGVTPSWSTVAAYDAGTLIAAIVAPTLRAKNATAAQGRARLVETKATAPYATFSGVSGRLVTGEGFVDNAQTLRAENGVWVNDSP